ncbi:hypothetical protein VKS41_004335 [Umbelopsis sp. WA50703]
MVRDEDEDAFYFLTSQQDQLPLSPALSSSTTCELDPDNPIDLATRIFYATCHKFTTVAQQPARYTFRQSLLLHSMYSKSQQTLLGMESIRPTVLLSGEDFMFTPPVPAIDWSLKDWTLDGEDDSFLEGCPFATSGDEGDQTCIQNNNMVTESDRNDVVDGTVSEVLIPHHQSHPLRVLNADEDLEAGNEHAKKVLAKELSNWFTTNPAEKMMEPSIKDAQDEDEGEEVQIEDIEQSESASLSSTCTSSGAEPESNDAETASEKAFEPTSVATTTTPEPLASIMQELEAYSSALACTKPTDTLSNETSDSPESMKAPKYIHDSLSNYVLTLQSLVKQKMQDSSVVQTVTANGVRVKTSIGFFTKWLSWLSSVIKVWKLFFLIAESLLVSFGDAILQSIIIHTLGRQLESVPALVAT